MRIDKFDRDLLVLFGLVALATYLAATIWSHGVLMWGDVLPVYLKIGLVGLVVGIIAVVVLGAATARRSGISPLREVLKALSDTRQWLWLSVPALIAPIFLASFTVAKTLIGIRLGFTWDAFFVDLDHAIFGMDAWRYTHALFGTKIASGFLEIWYVGWGAAVAFSMPLVAVMAQREHCAKFMLAMFLTWAIAGLCVAALFSSAGPCFAGAFDRVLGARFAPLTERLAQLLSQDNAIQMTQRYLARHWNAKVAVTGGGISAFPSVHVAVAVLYVIASWQRPLLRYASLFFAAMIWIGSIHFGYHYAVDGIASAAIAYVAWWIASRTVVAFAQRHQLSAVPA